MNDLQPPAGSDILVLVAHPSLEQSRANLRLMQAAAGASARVEVRDPLFHSGTQGNARLDHPHR